MSMQSMSVTPARVHEIAGQVRSESQQIASDLDHLEKRINALRGKWSGESQAAYTQAQARWSAQLSEMQQLLATVASKTEEIASGYTATDKSAAQLFS